VDGYPVSSLRARLRVDRAAPPSAFVLDVELMVARGETVALLGPNGAGKTTALRALAGLVPLTGGRTVLDDTVLEDTDTGVRMPAERRPIGVVFQDYRLFPHLSALDNVAFGLRCRSVSRRTARAQALDWLTRVGLAEHAGARPAVLSGGQAQRVALARALAVRPRLLLLDEPLAALDAHTRAEVRTGLRHHLADFDGAALLVTHDPLDAMVLADRLVVVEAGRIAQEGGPGEIARRPRTEYVARLVGLNLYRGQAAGHQVRLAGGGVLHVAEALGGEVFVAFPPAAVALYRARPDGSPRNLWPVRVTGLEPHGDQVRIHLEGPVAVAADVTAVAVAELELAPGREVWAAVKAAETHAYPA
jgi:molybdate transport system ATP-binding protein